MTSPITVLIVEPNDHFRAGLCEILTSSAIEHPVETWPVDNGRDALALLAGHAPDLILVNAIMPRMSGAAFLQQVRQNDAWRHIPIAMLTPRATAFTPDHEIPTGADVYISLPLNPPRLVTLANQTLGQIHARRTEAEILHLLATRPQAVSEKALHRWLKRRLLQNPAFVETMLAYFKLAKTCMHLEKEVAQLSAEGGQQPAPTAPQRYGHATYPAGKAPRA